MGTWKDELIRTVGPRGYLDRPEDLRLYEYDGGVDKARPEIVVFPRSTEEVSAVVRVAHRNGVPIVGRGAGTGLSGGAIPEKGGIMVGFSRMNRILEIDLANERAVVEPGVVNLDISLAVDAAGYFYAPDPSSQRACTIGGNVAENAGGPHTLAYGVTTNHVLGLEVVLPDGTVMQTGAWWPDTPGYDLTGLLTGSEGTMGLVTKVIIRLMKKPECVKTVLAIFDSVDDCALSVSEITARAITPAAVEMLDGCMLKMVEDAVHAGYPLDADGVLLIELEGVKEAVEEQAEQVRQACEYCHAREFRVARSELERQLLWKGRKNAFGAIGRVSPFYYVHDGVVPRTQIAPTLRRIGEISRQQALTIGNIFHAGDGNMHPIILFDARKPGDLGRAQKAGFDILEYCIQVGGSITGEHGIGMEKVHLMDKQFSVESLDMMRRIRDLFDPGRLFNPGKLLPAGRGCAEIRQPPLIAGNPVY
ncbi:FAD-linked oxidase C-terminal domain-containing protein [uncultured Paludibaculum sp.]|uniref:FAD-linked oxidase C-terminal domain-containing protein n=1 Tax=uncultured Paludibaculum sp. TaxID=1765020 RepID=UPI002AAAB2EC|nr:FAD-linked oxidase C-terminal domain-containing protein [uncultured Paludibaculum sp.]